MRVCGGGGVCDAVSSRRPMRSGGGSQKWVCLLLLFMLFVFVFVCVFGCLMIRALCGSAMCIYISQLYITTWKG